MSLNVIFHKFNYILVRMVSTKEWLHDQQMQQYLVLIQFKVSILFVDELCFWWKDYFSNMAISSPNKNSSRDGMKLMSSLYQITFHGEIVA